MIRKLALVLLLLLAALPARAQTVINATSCSQAALQTAWNSMSSGSYTIVLPSCAAGGTGSWSSTPLNLTIPSAVTSLIVQGQSVVSCTGAAGTSSYLCTATDNTVLQNNFSGSSNSLLQINTGSASTFFRWTGISFLNGTATTAPSSCLLQFVGSSHNFRFDHNHFDTTGFPITPLPIRVFGDIQGVADHNLFVMPHGSPGEAVGAFNSGSSDSFGDANWAAPTGWGSSGFYFVESNYFNGGSINDCYNGGRIVVRYNTTANQNYGGANVVLHQTGGGAGRPRGCRASEIYNNYQSTAFAGNFAAIAGASTQVIWDNTTFGYQHAMGANIVRSDPGHSEAAPPTAWGNCGTTTTGGTAWDGRSATTGWPCLDQPGRGRTPQALNGLAFPNALNSVTGTIAWPQQYSEPAYLWGNSVTGPGASTAWSNSGSGDVAANRDVYSDASPFTGATGTGQGLLSSRPSTCTAGPGGTFFTSPTGSYGVAYFATDKQALYICTATNTWTQVYTPFIYPHPLVSGGGGLPVVSLNPASVAFGSVLVGSTSPVSTITLTNTGGSTLTGSPIVSLGGTNPTDFTESDNCANAVLAGGSCQVTVTCKPLSAASFSASVIFTNNAAGSPQTVPLTCTGTTATAQIGFSPTNIAFAAQTVGTSSSPTAVTVSNPGGANLVITGVVPTGGNSTSFTQTNNCTTVAPSGTCTINVTFSPKVAGALSSSICVTDNAAGSPQCFAVTGTGNGVPGIAFSPTSLAFGNETVGGTTAPLSVTVSNPGTATLSVSSIALDIADTFFAISSNTCGATLTVGSTCVVSVTFTPGSVGSFTMNLNFTDNAAGSPQKVAGTGSGTQAGTSFSPTSLAFGNQNVSTTSAPLTTTLTNNGSTTLNISSITTTNPDYSISSKTCGTTLGVSASCTVSVAFTPSVPGTDNGNLSFADNAPASPQTVPLTGSGISTSMSISPSSLSFPAIVVGQTSASQNITVLNTGSTAITFTSITASGDFQQTNNCGGSLIAGAGCTVIVMFNPTATGTRSGAVVFTDSVATSPQSVALTGTGTQSGAVVSPTSIAFPNTPVSTASAAQNVTLQNNGTATLNIASFLLGGTDPSYFIISAHTCGTTLAPSASCTVSIEFNPQTAISASGTLTFTDDGPASPQVVTLSGLGTFLALSFSPASLSFGSVNVGTTSPAQTFTIANNGNGVATISSITIIGTNLGDFSQTNNCPPNLSGGGSCTVSVKFLPTASGARSASVQVTDNAPGSPQTVALTGTGVTPTAGISLSPTSLTFSSQGVGTSSAPQSITVSNPGSGNLIISSVAVSGDYSQTDNCTTVAPAGTCTVNVTFTPTTTGTRAGVLTLSDNAAGSPHTAALTGTGTAASVSFVPASLTFPNTAVSTASAALTTTLKNTGGASLTSIVISVTGTNAADYAQTNNCGTSVVAGGSCTINVTFTPSANGSRAANVQVVDNIGTQTVSLQGTGFTPAPAVSLSVASINFGDQTVSTQSNPHTVVLTNVGTATLTVSAATKTGTNPGDYSVTTTCGSTLAVNAMCSYSIVFIPTGAGSRTATLNVNTNAASSPDLVSLTGNGVASPQGVPSPQSFGDD